MDNIQRTKGLLPNQCGSSLVQTIDAPLHLVWSILRKFDHPQAYKRFIKSCTLLNVATTACGTGSVREVTIISGLPATTSAERLDKLDDDLHVMQVSVIGGDHRLKNYHSTTSLKEIEGGRKTVVVESYVVDVPEGNSGDDTCTFVETIIGCNLRSLGKVVEKLMVADN
ncbi:hypothetical protein EZV62_014388 [Acer yangbiense]|uniref:Uncharacterized protein n=1 Tax=Acer yangbiense TaxID=1000413 RepID=A0A5C7HSI4_9ROSI|nr:hypothetical protein EZV62_014388 [Acer yangbiense]